MTNYWPKEYKLIHKADIGISILMSGQDWFKMSLTSDSATTAEEVFAHQEKYGEWYPNRAVKKAVHSYQRRNWPWRDEVGIPRVTL